MVFAEGDRGERWSPEATQLYGAIARQEWDLVDTLQTAHPNARRELLAWGLIGDEEHPVARDPQQALRTMVTHELQEALRHINLVATMPDLSRDLIREYRQVQLRAGGSSEYLATPEAVNVRIRDVVADARREILAAQPGGPRSRELLAVAVERDAAALDRGIELRTIYRDTVRDHAVTAEYARTMATRTGGRRAEYGTMVGPFNRMIIVDREQAFVPDLIVEGSPEHSAWHVTDRAVVAVLADVYDTYWRRADPWHGELRARRGRLEVDTVSGAGPVATTARQREIMRCLVAGMTQAAVARKIGVPKRTLEDEIAALKRLSGADTAMQLAYWWAHCPDRDDTGSPDAPERAAAAVA